MRTSELIMELADGVYPQRERYITNLIRTRAKRKASLDYAIEMRIFQWSINRANVRCNQSKQLRREKIERIRFLRRKRQLLEELLK